MGVMTVEQVRQEFQRFANEDLSREFQLLGERLERMLDRQLSSRTNGSMVAMPMPRELGKSIKRDSVEMGHVRSLSSIQQRRDSFEVVHNRSNRRSEEYSLLRNSNLGVIEEEGHDPPSSQGRAETEPLLPDVRTNGDAHLEARAKIQPFRPDDDSLKLWIPVRQFPKRGATSTEISKESMPHSRRCSDLSMVSVVSGRGSLAKKDKRTYFRKSFWQGDLEDTKKMRKGQGRTVRFRQSLLKGDDEDLGPDIDLEDESIDPPSALEAFVEGDFFNSLVVSLILLNMFFIAFETDYLARHWENNGPFWFKIIEAMFCAAFVLEMGLRVASFGCSHLLDPGNIFDALMVAFQVLETFMTFESCLPLHATTQFRVLRIVRVFRMLRVTRIFRVIHHVRELKLLVSTTLESLRPLVWMLLPLAMISICFSVVLTQIATEHKLDEKRGAMLHPELESYFGSVDRALLALYQIISDGCHWGELMEPLVAFATPWIQVFFVAYVALTVLGMMNVIMGIFVDSVARAAEHSKKRALVNSMQQFFDEIDTDGSGTVEWDEFEAQLENPTMLSYLKEIDLDRDQASDLFRILDIEGCGSIDPQDWLSGCLTFAGPAKALDLAMLLHQVQKMAKSFSEHADKVETTLDDLELHFNQGYLMSDIGFAPVDSLQP